MSQAPARKLRTWSRFGQIRRVPSEYEIVTHDTNYTTRPGRAAALESNPTTPVNMWFLTYRDHSPLSADDWHGFRDPDELTYRKYVTMQDEQETVVEGILDEFGKVNHDANLSLQWLQVLATVFTPMRFPAHALQMTQAYLGQIAPSSYITNCTAFAAVLVVSASRPISGSSESIVARPAAASSAFGVQRCTQCRSTDAFSGRFEIA